MRTIVGVNDAKSVKRWTGLLAYDISQKAYWGSKFMGKGQMAETPLQLLTDLETDAGEQIYYDLLAEMRMAPIEGEDYLKGREEQQRFSTDSVYIDQARCGTNTGGRMTRKRTLHNLREKAKFQQASWWARFFDELCFIYLSGARGVNTNFLLPTTFTGRANNSLSAPDTNHQLYGGDCTAKNGMTNEAPGTAGSDTMGLDAIDRCVTRALAQGGGPTDITVMQPCKVNGEDTFVMLMHVWQEDDMRKNTSTGQWLDIQKAAAASDGRNSPLFKGTMGMYRGCVLHSHRNVIRFSDYGAGGTYSAARALFLGAQAGVVAFGSTGNGMRYDWNEETDDRGDKVIISSAAVFGVKKVTFTVGSTSNDLGVFAVDTYCAVR